MAALGYSGSEAKVLNAGRALADALAGGDPFEIQGAAHALARIGGSWEQTASVSGFRSDSPTPESFDPDAALDQILSELEVGHTLVAAGKAVDEAVPAEAGAAGLEDALDDLSRDRKRRLAGPPAGGHFAATTDDRPPLVALRSGVDDFLADVVSRTTSVATEAIKGLATLPASVVQPWLTAAGAFVTDAPAVGRLVALGLRAVRRAVNALLRLVPESARAATKKLAAKWWTERGADDVAARLVGLHDVRRRADEILHDGLTSTRLGEAASDVRTLSSRHESSIGTIKRILKVLTAILGPLVAHLAVAAGWLYAAAAAGFVAALSGAIWLGRDCLDTGAGWERLDGVQVILGRVAS